MQLSPSDPSYPDALRLLPSPPELNVSGALTRNKTVAIVGSRHPLANMERFAGELARALAQRGITVVSGGARGIDRAAHEGAMEAGGATWVVCGTGRSNVFPPEHGALFDAVGMSETSRMIWPFADATEASAVTFRARNGVLVALSDAVVVIQAKLQSGSRNAATWARSLGRQLWVVPGLPWSPYVERFSGSSAELRAGARALTNMAELFEALEADADAPRVRPTELKRKKKHTPQGALFEPRARPPAVALTDEEQLVFSKLYESPVHLDRIVDDAGLTVGVTMTALLTLSMKDVVVEGPDGFFRRKTAG